MFAIILMIVKDMIYIYHLRNDLITIRRLKLNRYAFNVKYLTLKIHKWTMVVKKINICGLLGNITIATASSATFEDYNNQYITMAHDTML